MIKITQRRLLDIAALILAVSFSTEASLHTSKTFGRRSQSSAVAKSISAGAFDVLSAMVAAMCGSIEATLLFIRLERSLISAIVKYLRYLL